MTRNRSFEAHSGWGAAVVLAAAVAGAPLVAAMPGCSLSAADVDLNACIKTKANNTIRTG